MAVVAGVHASSVPVTATFTSLVEAQAARASGASRAAARRVRTRIERGLRETGMGPRGGQTEVATGWRELGLEAVGVGPAPAAGRALRVDGAATRWGRRNSPSTGTRYATYTVSSSHVVAGLMFSVPFSSVQYQLVGGICWDTSKARFWRPGRTPDSWRSWTP